MLRQTNFSIKLKAPDRCAQLFDRKCYLITDKHTEVLDCISNGQMDGSTDATKHIISLASRSINICKSLDDFNTICMRHAWKCRAAVENLRLCILRDIHAYLPQGKDLSKNHGQLLFLKGPTLLSACKVPE